MRWFKRSAIVLGVLVVVLALGLTALFVFVDPNRYKAPVAEAVKKRYDRTLRIDGELRLAFFPRLGVEVDRVSLSEPGSTQIFAAVDSARVFVALLPLLSNRLVVDRVKVDGLKANVVRDRSGRFNFDDLLRPASVPAPGRAPAPAGPPAPSGGALELDVAGVEFNGGELAVRDYATGRALRVERLSATAGRIAPKLPFDIELSARVLGQNPRVDANVQGQARLTFDPAARRFAAQGLDFKANGVLPSVRATAFTARGNVSFDAQRQALDVSGASVVFQGDLAGSTPLTAVDARAEIPALNVGLAEGRIQVEKLALSAQGKAGADPFDFQLSAPRLQVSDAGASGDPISGHVRLAGDSAISARFGLSGVSGNAEKLNIERVSIDAELKQGSRVVKLEVGTPLEANVRHKTLLLSRVAGQARIDDASLPGGAMAIPLTGTLRADFERETLAARLGATIDGGKASVSADAISFDAPRVAFSVSAERLDLDKLLPPARSPAPAGQAEPPAAEAPPSDTRVDLSGLRGVTAHGNVKIGSLRVRGLAADDVAATLRVAKGRADVSGLKASLYGGSLSGSLFADANTHRIGFAPTLTNVSLQPLLADLASQDTLIGRGAIALNLSASGKSVQRLKKTLNGTAQLSLRDGAVKGMNLAQSLREFKAMLAADQDAVQRADQTLQTDFSELQANLVFANGVGTVRSLNMKAPLLRVNEGEPARIDIGESRLELQALVTVVNTSTGQGGKELAQLRNITVPVLVTGPLDAPEYRVQWSRAGRELVKNAVKEKLEDKIDLGRETDRLKQRLKGLFGR